MDKIDKQILYLCLLDELEKEALDFGRLGELYKSVRTWLGTPKQLELEFEGGAKAKNLLRRIFFKRFEKAQKAAPVEKAAPKATEVQKAEQQVLPFEKGVQNPIPKGKPINEATKMPSKEKSLDLEKIKAHFRKHWPLYAIGGGGIAVGRLSKRSRRD